MLNSIAQGSAPIYLCVWTQFFFFWMNWSQSNFNCRYNKVEMFFYSKLYWRRTSLPNLIFDLWAYKVDLASYNDVSLKIYMHSVGFCRIIYSCVTRSMNIWLGLNNLTRSPFTKIQIWSTLHCYIKTIFTMMFRLECTF